MTTDQQTRPLAVSAERCEELLTQLVGIRSVVGEDTTAHLWVSARLRELGFDGRALRGRGSQGAARARRARG